MKKHYIEAKEFTIPFETLARRVRLDLAPDMEGSLRGLLEAALKIALETGEIAGAGLEAFLDEPTHNWELVDLPNLVCLPHLGGNSKESILAMGNASIAHLREFFHI